MGDFNEVLKTIRGVGKTFRGTGRDANRGTSDWLGVFGGSAFSREDARDANFRARANKGRFGESYWGNQQGREDTRGIYYQGERHEAERWYEQRYGGRGGAWFQRQSYSGDEGVEVPGITGGTGIYLGGSRGAQVIRGGDRDYGRTYGADASSTGNEDLDTLLASLGDTRAVSSRPGRTDPAALDAQEMDVVEYNLRRNQLSSQTLSELTERVSEMPEEEKQRLATSLNSIGSAFGQPRMLTLDDEAIATRLGDVARMQSPNDFRKTQDALSIGAFRDIVSDEDDIAFNSLVGRANNAGFMIQQADKVVSQLPETARKVQQGIQGIGGIVGGGKDTSATGFGGADGVLTLGEKGTDAVELQQALKDAGFGNMLGTTGRNGDGIDGDPEKLTFAAARQAGSVMASLGVHDGRTVDADFIEALKKNAGVIKDKVGKGGLSA